MLTALIVDDEDAGAKALKKDLAMYCPDIRVMDIANSADEAEKKIKLLSPAIVFLDVEMPHASGFDLLARFNEIKFEVIFVTAYNEYALKAIKYNALDYLLKPVDADELMAAVKKCENKLAKGHNEQLTKETMLMAIAQLQRTPKLPVATQEGILYLDLDNIIRFEGNANYTDIHISGGKKIMSSKTLKDFEGLVEGQRFFRIHKAHLVNLKYATKYIKGEGGYLTMTDGSTLEVSRQKKQELLALLAQ